VSDIFREVDEEVRKDKALEIWKKYGNYVIIACVALVVGTGGRVAWREYQADLRLTESRQYVAAVRQAEAGQTSEAIAALQALSSDANTGYGVVAGFREAQALGESGDRDGAVAVLDRIAKDGDAGDLLQELAQLFTVMWLIDDAPAADIEKRLSELTGAEAPWRFSARELAAVLKLREGDLEGARTGFKTLSEEAGVPNGIRTRAREMVAALGGGE
jgi:hypothetical protein